MTEPTYARLLDATYTCIARYGMGKTTVEDVARLAGVSRATVYRHVPGGRDQLIADTVTREVGRFFRELAEAAGSAPDLASLLEEALVFAHRALAEHEVLQKVLQTEPERLLPLLTTSVDRLIPLITAFLAPWVEAGERPAGVEPREAADYLARMTLSFLGTAGRWDLTDRAQVRELVGREFLAGIRVEGREGGDPAGRPVGPV